MSGTTDTSRRVFRTLSIFGGVQVFNILCSLIRTKCIALWLGPAGIGLFGLFNGALGVINMMTQLNLRSSSVRYILSENGSRKVYLIGVVRNIARYIGIVGALMTVLLSPLLSKLTFGNYDYTISFILLSIVVFVAVFIEGEQAILQATNRLKKLAHATMWGGGAAMLVSILLIRVMGVDGIVPSIVAYTIFAGGIYLFYRDKTLSKHRISVSETLKSATPIVKLGMYMTIAMLTTSISIYLFQIWLRHESGEDGVGIYQAGYTVINQYVGLIFTAMAVEFYPRISGIIDHKHRTRLYVRHESMMLMWGLLGCIVLFVNVVPILVHVLYDSSFVGVNNYLTIASIGTPFKAVSFVLAYVILAKGDGKTYVVTEMISSILYIVYNVLGYKLRGLDGLGCAYVLWYVSYALIVYIVYRYRYGMVLGLRVILMTLIVATIVAAQAAICVSGYYLAATVVTCLVTPCSGVLFYRLFLKRKTLKE